MIFSLFLLLVFGLFSVDFILFLAPNMTRFVFLIFYVLIWVYVKLPVIFFFFFFFCCCLYIYIDSWVVDIFMKTACYIFFSCCSLLAGLSVAMSICKLCWLIFCCSVYMLLDELFYC